ncbi:MAG TPA: hypothetical protein VFK16_08655 [Gemmatimonadaceae bacterium]|nr:hypothetical protein [Gemmatimonadaceae bacterium]
MRWFLGVVALSAMAVAASAQEAWRARLDSELDAATRVAVLAMVDSARVARLPAMALVNKALEGAGKRASGAQIVAAVQSLGGELRASRTALGHASRPDEITAGAHALHAGVDANALGKLRRVSVGRELTTPLTVLTDLVARGVPPAAASDAVITLTQAGLRDAGFSKFQQAVRLDIDHGADPASATRIRARGAVIGRGGAPRG